MLRTSEILIAHPEIDDFDEFVKKVKEIAKNSTERFFKMDVKPDYHNTPENWEDLLEAVFY